VIAVDANVLVYAHREDSPWHATAFRIATICLLHGIDELWTADRDFGRFPQLNARNPLIA